MMGSNLTLLHPRGVIKASKVYGRYETGWSYAGKSQIKTRRVSKHNENVARLLLPIEHYTFHINHNRERVHYLHHGRLVLALMVCKAPKNIVAEEDSDIRVTRAK